MWDATNQVPLEKEDLNEKNLYVYKGRCELSAVVDHSDTITAVVVNMNPPPKSTSQSTMMSLHFNKSKRCAFLLSSVLSAKVPV